MLSVTKCSYDRPSSDSALREEQGVQEPVSMAMQLCNSIGFTVMTTSPAEAPR